jgi:hypothetical protein
MIVILNSCYDRADDLNCARGSCGGAADQAREMQVQIAMNRKTVSDVGMTFRSGLAPDLFLPFSDRRNSPKPDGPDADRLPSQ